MIGVESQEVQDKGHILGRLVTIVGLGFIGAYFLSLVEDYRGTIRPAVYSTVPSEPGSPSIASIPLDESIQTVPVTLSPEDQAILDAIEAHHSGSSVAEASSTSEATPPEEAVVTTHAEHVPDSTVQTVATQGSVAPETSHNHPPAPVTNTTVQSAPNTTAHSGNHDPAATTTAAPVQSSPVVTQPASPETVPATPSGTVPIPAG
jgi:hypothetical protein